MTVGSMLSQMGIGTHAAAERYSEYHGPPPQEQHIYYSYEPHAHNKVAASKHSYHGGGKKNHAAMSALTLLAFLFFLHILQQCLREHMQSMATAPIMIMTAAKEGDEKIEKTSDSSKIDKTGNTKFLAIVDKRDKELIALKNKIESKKHMTQASHDLSTSENPLTKVHTAQHVPKRDGQSYGHWYNGYPNRSSGFPGFVSAVPRDSL